MAEDCLRREIAPVKKRLQEEAIRILQEDLQDNREIGQQGQCLMIGFPPLRSDPGRT